MHVTPPELEIAQIEAAPAAIALMPLVMPETPTGVPHALVLDPAKSHMPSPQHLTPPETVIAQLWKSPTAIALTPLPRPTTATGVLLTYLAQEPWSSHLIFAPLPNCPLAL